MTAGEPAESDGESLDAPGRARRGADWLRTHSRHTLRIARWEVTKNAGGVDKRMIAIAVIAVLGLGLLAPMAASQGVTLDADMYRVGVVEEDSLYEPAAYDPTFRVQQPSQAAIADGRQDVLIVGPQVRDHADSQKGRAAVAELRSTTERYNDLLMLQEENRTAAFPVVVNLTYQQQNVTRVIAPQSQTIDVDSGESDDGAGDGSGDAVDGRTDGQSGTDGDSSQAADRDAAQDSDGAAGGESGGDGGDGEGGDAGGELDGSNEGLGGSSFAARLTGDSVSGTPSNISPPFPFRSLVLAFVFVLPLNFVIQAYGSTILSERINRRGELLLVSPVSRGDVIVGKTLPYFLGSIGVATLITLALRGSIVSVLAIVPLAMLFLSATFLGAMFARSFKELTFVTVTITVSLTSYAFVPAIFTDVTPIALISPLTLVVRDLQGQAIGLGQFAFSTLPPTLTAVVLFALGAGLYREEDMFTQRPIPLKVLDALAGRVKGPVTAGLTTAMLLPFVLVAELVLVAFMYPLTQAGSIELVIVVAFVGIALIEELAKSLHVYAGYVHARFDDRLRTALVVGACSGIGFFVAEKFTLIARLAGLQDLPIGQAVMGDQAALSSGVPLPVVLAALLLAPFALHVVTAAISATGARRGRRSYAVALAIAITVHVAYNLTVVSAIVR